MQAFETDIKKCIEVLNDKGVILYPTDTVWGLGCDATDEEAVAKIFAIKKRADSKALIVLVATEYDVIKYTKIADENLFHYLKKNDTPTTVIYKQGYGFAQNLLAENGSIAIRICRDNFCKALIEKFQKPIVSTSANISGEPAPATFAQIRDEIKNTATYIVQHRQNDSFPAAPSAIITWKNDEAVYLRK